MNTHRITDFFLLLLVILSSSASLRAQTPTNEFVDAIEDNSFFVEEAFNQEHRVVQHIFNGMFFKKPNDESTLTLTQEWPINGQDHQLSVTIPYLWLNENRVNDLGDVLINYRYQLTGVNAWAFISPRLSLILPTGNVEKGFGAGVVGLQANLPISKRLTNAFIFHANAGATILPNAEKYILETQRVKKTRTSFNLGGSLIWLASYHLNFLGEFVFNSVHDVNEAGDAFRVKEYIISPGLRIAIDFHDLQIVPGFAYPIRFVDGDSQAGIFGYLSFEHPF